MAAIPHRSALSRRRLRRALGSLLLLPGLGFGCSVRLAAQGANDPLAAASALVRAGRYDDALAVLHKALQAHPSDPRLHTVEGLAYSLKGDDTDALRSLQEALTVAPGFPRALQAEASILSRRHDPAVIPILQQILKENPRDSTAHEMLALAEAQKGDCAAALPEFGDAGPALATHADSLQRKAACQLATEAYAEAVATFQQVRSLRPEDPGTLYDLAVAQTEAGDPKAASLTLAPLLAHSPDPDTLLLAADAAEGEGDTPRAASLLRQAIVAEPTRSEAYVRFAELCMAHESYQAGVDMVSAGLARQPHDASLLLARGLLYGGLAQYDRAEQDFAAAERDDPQHGTGAYAVGLIESQRNDPGKALTTVRAALQAHPDDPQLHFLLARLLLEMGAQPGSAAYGEATHSAQQAVQLQPGLVAAHDLLAKIDLDTGQPAEAVAQCRAALKLDPTDSNALYRLMRALRATGDDAAAQAVARQVATQHQQARDQETTRLRYRIEDSTSAKATQAPAAAPR